MYGQNNTEIINITDSLSTEKLISCYDIYIEPTRTNEVEISGQVIDEGREPLIGVIIVVKETNKGTQSDYDGNFRIKVRAEDTVVFSMIGMESKEVPVSAMRNGRAIVSMKESITILCHDVVVIKNPMRDDIYEKRNRRITKLSYTEASKVPISEVGKLDSFEVWVQNNIIYTEQMQKDKVQGEVILSFSIDKKGNLTDKKVIGKLSDEADQEALRALSLSKKWTPGMYNDKPIKTTMTIKVNFDYK